MTKKSIPNTTILYPFEEKNSPKDTVNIKVNPNMLIDLFKGLSTRDIKSKYYILQSLSLKFQERLVNEKDIRKRNSNQGKYVKYDIDSQLLNELIVVGVYYHQELYRTINNLEMKSWPIEDSKQAFKDFELIKEFNTRSEQDDEFSPFSLKVEFERTDKNSLPFPSFTVKSKILVQSVLDHLMKWTDEGFNNDDPKFNTGLRDFIHSVNDSYQFGKGSEYKDQHIARWTINLYRFILDNNIIPNHTIGKKTKFSSQIVQCICDIYSIIKLPTYKNVIWDYSDPYIDLKEQRRQVLRWLNSAMEKSL